MARLRRWRRPLTLIMLPRFSANPAPGRTDGGGSGRRVGQDTGRDEAREVMERSGSDTHFGGVLAQTDQRVDFFAVDALDDGREFARGYAEQFRAASVRIAVDAEENVVALAGARHHVEQLALEHPREPARHVELLVRHARAGDDGDLLRPETHATAPPPCRWRASSRSTPRASGPAGGRCGALEPRARRAGSGNSAARGRTSTPSSRRCSRAASGGRPRPDGCR